MGDLDQYLKENTFLKVLIKGKYGEGKTVLAAQATHIWKTLFIDCEGGIVSSLDEINRENIVARIIREVEHEQFFSRLADAMEEAESGDYECVVVDTVTEIASRMEDEYSLQGEGGHTKWSGLLERVSRFGRRLRDLKAHTIVCAHTKTASKDDPASQFDVGIPGQSGQRFPAYFDVVGVMAKKLDKGKASHTFTTSGPTMFGVRDRWRAFATTEIVTEANPGALWKKLYDGMQRKVLGRGTPKKTSKK